jgi:hypothetical protein
MLSTLPSSFPQDAFTFFVLPGSIQPAARFTLYQSRVLKEKKHLIKHLQDDLRMELIYQTSPSDSRFPSACACMFQKPVCLHTAKLQITNPASFDQYDQLSAFPPACMVSSGGPTVDAHWPIARRRCVVDGSPP